MKKQEKYNIDSLGFNVDELIDHVEELKHLKNIKVLVCPKCKHNTLNLEMLDLFRFGTFPHCGDMLPVYYECLVCGTTHKTVEEKRQEIYSPCGEFIPYKPMAKRKAGGKK